MLTVLGLLDADPVAVACIGAASAGLPASPSCGGQFGGAGASAGTASGGGAGILALNGAESRALAAAGVTLVGIGAFMARLRRRAADELLILENIGA